MLTDEPPAARDSEGPSSPPHAASEEPISNATRQAVRNDLFVGMALVS